jgi:phage gpG-like protein
MSDADLEKKLERLLQSETERRKLVKALARLMHDELRDRARFEKHLKFLK